eukprot:CAMPEP_0175797586 /NCGR_PEP_ID=MMETSP0097-20121207/85545_1 /TAXON_ID=311494 /ORGANISM="Alexandrium monilatum, Strain CCMP3105" /LENGTH=121 /DNA_ID=CAMNT_0017108783 /DNA_START=221 /DNA_END=583 /DNA_ORIENTATION=+
MPSGGARARAGQPCASNGAPHVALAVDSEGPAPVDERIQISVDGAIVGGPGQPQKGDVEAKTWKKQTPLAAQFSALPSPSRFSRAVLISTIPAGRALTPLFPPPLPAEHALSGALPLLDNR